MGIDFTLERAQLCLICHLAQLFGAGNFQLRGDNLRQPNGHLLQRRGDLVRVAVVDFQRTGNHAFLRQRDHQHRVNFRRAIGFIVVFNDDFAVVNRLTGDRANGVIVIVVVIFPDADIGQHAFGIGDSDGVGANILTNDVANLSQSVAVNLTKQRQRFVGNIQRQLSLTRGAGLFLALYALHQQDNKADAHAAGNHRNADLRHDIDAERDGGRPNDHQNHGQGFAQHAAEDTNFPVQLFRYPTVNQPRQDSGDNTGDKTRHGGNAACVNQVTVDPGNDPDDAANPRAKQDPA